MKTDRFPLVMFVSVTALVLAIVLVVLGGDQIGLQVKAFAPTDSASSQTAITITFSDEIDLSSISSYFQIQPAVEGWFSAKANQIIFYPNTPLTEGTTYRATARAGITGKTLHETLKHDVMWSFKVRTPRIVYLAPIAQTVQNLYVVDPAQDAAPQQITFSERGVSSYSVSSDGNQIVYSQLVGLSNIQLFLWDAVTNTTALLYDCSNARCTNPTWQPHGNFIAFEHTSLDPELGVISGVPRIWMIDVVSKQARPLLNDGQRIGYGPRWSPDGQRLAFYEQRSEGIVLYDVTTNEENVIASPFGETGRLSPDGRWLAAPKVLSLSDGSTVLGHSLVDLSNVSYPERNLTSGTAKANDVELAWFSDSQYVLVARFLTTEGTQLYKINIETLQAKLLLTQMGYSIAQLALAPSGDKVVFLRSKLARAESDEELCIFVFTTENLVCIVENGLFPQWLP